MSSHPNLHQQSDRKTDQQSLFADVENDQQTLGDENAATWCLFENSESSTDGGDEEQ